MESGIGIRPAIDAELSLIRGIEEAADHGFVNWALGEGRGVLTLVPGEGFGDLPSGEERASEPGFLLVGVDEGAGGRVVGFVHVLEIEGACHLEQVSVLPEDQGRGIGRSLVQAACDRAAARGYGAITLRTFADVPFNGPFYASMGFEESVPDTAWLQSLVGVEERAGLMKMGRRVQMTRKLVDA